MIEQNDINDGTVIQGTTQRTDEKGNVRFVYTLPSGKVMCSEWIAPDMRKTALVRWLDAVRANIVDDLNTTRRERIEAAKAMTQPRPTSAEPAVLDRVPAETSSPQTVTAVADTTDPLAYIRSQVEAAEYAYSEAVNALQIAELALTEAATRRARWRKVLDALDGQEKENGEVESEIV